MPKQGSLYVGKLNKTMYNRTKRECEASGTEAAPVNMRCPKCGQDVFLHGETCPTAPPHSADCNCPKCIYTLGGVTTHAAASPEEEPIPPKLLDALNKLMLFYPLGPKTQYDEINAALLAVSSVCLEAAPEPDTSEDIA